MQINANQKLLDQDPAAKALVSLLEESEQELQLSDAVLYHDFPFYLDENGESAKANIMLVSKKYGVIVYHCSAISTRTITSANINNIGKALDNTFSLIYSKLIRSKNLRSNPMTLSFDIYPIIFLTNTIDRSTLDGESSSLDIVTNKTEMVKRLSGFQRSELLDDEIFREITAILEGSKGIVKTKSREIPEDAEDTKGAILEKIEADIATFDQDQKSAALVILDGPQRIRGLAGSGKTIVLAMKAAQIHLQEPDAEILYTFFTKSLYDLIKRLITRFYRQFAEKDPNWEKIHILHAWGGRGVDGVYYKTCLENNVSPLTYGEVKNRTNPFGAVCDALLKNDLIARFDYSLLDEAQDFPQSFYRLCRKITKNNRVIWGYDEAQNILNIEMQDARETFGKDKNGKYYIDFSTDSSDRSRDLVLHKCYRNPRKNLVAAFALGLGIYNHRILQMPENNAHWEDLGFKVEQGNSEENDFMKINRPAENSPLVKNNLLENKDTILVDVYDNFGEECKKVGQSILEDLKQNLNPQDILLISLDDHHARGYFAKISEILEANGVNTYNHLTAPTSSKTFSRENSVTMTTVYRAKGNEAGVVYILGIDAVYQNKDSISERNKLFTAITRSIGWVKMSGVGDFALLAKLELQKVLDKYPILEFVMPDREGLKIFQRDLSKEQDLTNSIEKQLEELESLGKSPEQLFKEIAKRQDRLKKKA